MMRVGVQLVAVLCVVQGIVGALIAPAGADLSSECRVWSVARSRGMSMFMGMLLCVRH